jgi:hypothetical protein
MNANSHYGSSNIAAATLAIALSVSLALLLFAYRKRRKIGPLLIVGGYFSLLSSLFLVGVLGEYGYGGGFHWSLLRYHPTFL